MKNEASKECTTHLEPINQLIEPALYQVVVHNDDFTPMEFVMGTLETFFYMNRCRAAEVMLEAHIKGRAGCGLFSKDFAESKVSQVIEHARLYDHPLICSMEAMS